MPTPTVDGVGTWIPTRHRLRCSNHRRHHSRASPNRTLDRWPPAAANAGSGLSGWLVLVRDADDRAEGHSKCEVLPDAADRFAAGQALPRVAVATITFVRGCAGERCHVELRTMASRRSREACRRSTPVSRARTSLPRVGQEGPVVGVDHERLVISSWLQLPAPQVSRRRLVGLGRQPGDASSLDELDNVVDPSAPNRQHHRERVTDAPDGAVRRQPRRGCRCHPIPADAQDRRSARRSARDDERSDGKH